MERHSQVPHDCPRRLYNNKKGFFARAIICICMGVEEKTDTLFGKKKLHQEKKQAATKLRNVFSLCPKISLLFSYNHLF